MKIRIAIFASGSGSNAENIIRYFEKSDEVVISLVLTNNPGAGVIRRCSDLRIPCKVFNRSAFSTGHEINDLLTSEKIDFIILAGFLLLVPEALLRNYRGKIINIHPALLPAFGGRGFYGEKVHQAVIGSGTPISGITIHYVNEHFDDGEIIFQAACHVSSDDTPQSLAAKIHELEYAWFPVVIEKTLITLKNAGAFKTEV